MDFGERPNRFATYALLTGTIDAEIATSCDTRNDPSYPIAESAAAENEPEILIANDPDPPSNNTDSLNTLVAPSVVTACTGCNTCVTICVDPDFAIIAKAPLVNLYPSSYNNLVTVITFPPFAK